MRTEEENSLQQGVLPTSWRWLLSAEFLSSSVVLSPTHHKICLKYLQIADPCFRPPISQQNDFKSINVAWKSGSFHCGKFRSSFDSGSKLFIKKCSTSVCLLLNAQMVDIWSIIKSCVIWVLIILLYLPLFPPKKMPLWMTSFLISGNQGLFGFKKKKTTGQIQIRFATFQGTHLLIYLFNGMFEWQLLYKPLWQMPKIKEWVKHDTHAQQNLAESKRVGGHWQLLI